MIWTTSTECVQGLKRALLPTTGWPKGCFAVEIEAPRPRKLVRRRGRTRVRKTGPRRRADVIWAPANQGTLIGYEIKVSRADLIRELAEPAKTEAWKQYCDEWWLLVGNPAILTGLTIPEDWGILSPPAGRATKTLNLIQQAPDLKPTIDTVPAWARLSAWQAWKQYQAELQLEAGHEIPGLYEWEPDELTEDDSAE
jgi:hypothetical protein